MQELLAVIIRRTPSPEQIIANASTRQAWAAVAVAGLTAVLVVVTWRYASATKKLVDSSNKMTAEARAQGEATNRLAEAAVAQVAELVHHRNLLERQIHATSIEQIRAASIDLLDATKTHTQNRAHIGNAAQEWVSVMANRALSLPPDVFELLRKPMQIAQDIAARWGKFDFHDLASIAGMVSLASQEALDKYLRTPGVPLEDDYPLPDAGADYAAWLRDRPTA